jgi:hypothetical protein
VRCPAEAIKLLAVNAEEEVDVIPAEDGTEDSIKFVEKEESIRFRGRGSIIPGDGTTSSVNRDLSIATRASRNQPDNLAALAGFK